MRYTRRFLPLLAILILGTSCLRLVDRKPTSYSQTSGIAAGASSSNPACSVLSGASSLAYYGFYCSSCSWVGKGSYTSEVKDFSNLVWIAGDMSHTVVELQKARAAGIHAVVSALNVESLVTRDANGWNADAELMKTYVDDGTLVSMYIADDFVPDLASANAQIDMIHAKFPGLAISAFFDGAPDAKTIAKIDWVGVEMYQGYRDLEQLAENALTRPEQRILLIPGTFELNAYVPGKDESAKVAEYVDAIVAVARNNPLVVGVVPFLWQSQNKPGEKLTGASDLPGYRERVIELGKCSLDQIRENQGLAEKPVSPPLALVQNAASAQVGLSPGTVASLYAKTELPSGIEVHGRSPDGSTRSLQLLAQAGNQVNLVLPPDAPSGPLELQVLSEGRVLAVSRPAILKLSPALFSFGDNYANAEYDDGAGWTSTVGADGNPVPVPMHEDRGTKVRIYATGLRAFTPQTPIFMIIGFQFGQSVSIYPQESGPFDFIEFPMPAALRGQSEIEIRSSIGNGPAANVVKLKLGS